jgi:hypothetical protein
MPHSFPSCTVIRPFTLRSCRADEYAKCVWHAVWTHVVSSADICESYAPSLPIVRPTTPNFTSCFALLLSIVLTFCFQPASSQCRTAATSGIIDRSVIEGNGRMCVGYLMRVFCISILSPLLSAGFFFSSCLPFSTRVIVLLAGIQYLRRSPVGPR